MPFVVPWNGVLILSQWSPGLSVDDHDLTAGRIGLGPKMHIIEMLFVLITKEHTAVAMVTSILRTSNPKRYLHVARRKVFDQSDVMRTTHLGLIIADAFIEPESTVSILLENLPRRVVGSLPSRSTLLEILLEDHFANLHLIGLGILPHAIPHEPKHHEPDRPCKSHVHFSLCH